MNSEVQASYINLCFTIFDESTICFDNSSQFQVELHDSYEKALHHDKTKWPKRQLTVLHRPNSNQSESRMPQVALVPSYIQIRVITEYIGHTFLLDTSFGYFWIFKNKKEIIAMALW